MKTQSNYRTLFQLTLALLVLLFIGSGAAVASDAAGDSESYAESRATSKHRAGSRQTEQGFHTDHRYDRDRHDQHRYDQNRYDRHRYDRHRYDRHRYDRHRYDTRWDSGPSGSNYRYGDHYDRYRRRSFEIPRSIVRDLAHRYSAYYYGRHYHAVHRHYHQVYRFPVYSGYGVSYNPYAYCEGAFYGRGIFHSGGLRFDLHLNF